MTPSSPYPLRRRGAGRSVRAEGLVAAVATLLLLAQSGEARARQVKVTKTVDVTTKVFTLKKISVDHPLGKLRIRGWSKQRVRMRAVKIAPDGETVKRLRVHADINRDQNGRIVIRTGVLMSVKKPKDLAKTSKLMKRAQKIRLALAQLQKQPKPWTARNREQIGKLSGELLATLRAIQETLSGTLVEKLRSVSIKGASLELTVFVPKGVHVVGKTTSGDIDVANLKGPVTLTSRGGRIYARNVSGAVSTRTDNGHQFLSSIRGAVSADAYDGDLRLQSVRGASVRASLVRGRIFAYDLDATLIRLTTTQGPVTVTATLKASGRLEVRTRRGDIDVRLTPRRGFRMRVETRHGRLSLPRGARTTGPSPLRQRGRYGRGGPLLDLRSVFGDITLR